MRLSLGKPGFLFPSLILWGCSSSAWAVANLVDPPDTDKSMMYIGRIFGVVPGVLNGEAGALLANVYGVLNAVALTVGMGFLAYIVLTATLRTASEGETMGKQWSSIWIPIRAVAGVVSVLPLKTVSGLKGYCLMQALVMWIIVQGIGAADMIWTDALNYFKSGAPVVSYAKPDKGLEEAAGNILNNLVCMYAMQRYMQPNSIPPGYYYHWGNYVNGKKGALTPINPYPLLLQPDDAGFINYKESTTSFTARKFIPPALPNPVEQKNYHVYFGKGCGYVSWPNAKKLVNPATAYSDPSSVSHHKADLTYHVDKAIAEKQYTAVPQLIRALSPLAYNIVYQKTYQKYQVSYGGSTRTYYSLTCPKDRTCEATTRPLSQTIVSSALHQYRAEMSAAYTEAVADIPSNETSMKKQVLEQVRKDGWISAGSYYQTVAQTLNITNEASRSNFVPSSKGPKLDDALSEDYNFPASRFAPIRAKITQAGNYYKDLPKKKKDAQFPSHHLKASGIFAKFPGVKKFVNEFDNDIWQPALSGIREILKSGTNPEVDPLLAIQALGYTVMIVMSIALATVVGGGGVIAWLVSICGSWDGLGYAVQAVIQLITPIFSVIWLAIMGMAATMAYYIPLVPYVLFVFGAIAWFFMCIEAMTAAPLISLGLMHPEGHEVYGKAEGSIMLLLNLFLRPSLMIFGLIGAMLLSYVVFTMLNVAMINTFSLLFADVSLDQMLLTILNVFGMLFIYSTMLLILMPKVFSLIYELPSKVDRWLGGHGGGSSGDSIMEGGLGEVKSSHDQAGMAQAAKGMADSAPESTFAALRSEKRAAKRRKDKKGISTSNTSKPEEDEEQLPPEVPDKPAHLRAPKVTPAGDGMAPTDDSDDDSSDGKDDADTPLTGPSVNKQQKPSPPPKPSADTLKKMGFAPPDEDNDSHDESDSSDKDDDQLPPEKDPPK